MKQFIFILVTGLVSCTVFAQQDTTAAVQYIRAARLASNAAIAKMDVESVARFWKEDYVEISSDGSLIAGKKAVVADWKNMFANDPSIRFERQLQQIEFTRGGTVATEKGILVYTAPYQYRGYYTALWRKTGDVWLTQMENFVSVR